MGMIFQTTAQQVLFHNIHIIIDINITLFERWLHLPETGLINRKSRALCTKLTVVFSVSEAGLVFEFILASSLVLFKSQKLKKVSIW